MPESDAESERKRELEYLRLASDLMQLAKSGLEPALKAHCLRMARACTDQKEVPLVHPTRTIFSIH